MPTVYKCPEDVPDLDILDDLERVVARHDRFRPIAEFGLKVDLSLAYNDNGPAVKLHGSPALAKIKVVGPEDRSRGNGDVRVTVDAARYEALTPRQREAVLAHELFHVAIQTHPEVERGDDGKERIVSRPNLDFYERPVVKLIPDDWALTGFATVAAWYEDDSAEVRSYRALGHRLAEAVSVLPFPGDAPDADAGEPAGGSSATTPVPSEIVITKTDFARIDTLAKTARSRRS